eukprot:3183805-Prymnesium_polylepis.1
MRREFAQTRRKPVQTQSITFANASRIRENRVENFLESVANLRISEQNHCKFGANARRCGVKSPVRFRAPRA